MRTAQKRIITSVSHSSSRIFPPVPPIHLTFHHTITTQPQPQPSIRPFSQTLSSSTHNPQHSLLSSHNPPFNLPPSISNLITTSCDPHAAVHPEFHNYPQSSFPPHLPPSPLPPSSSTYPLKPPFIHPPPSVF